VKGTDSKGGTAKGERRKHVERVIKGIIRITLIPLKE
jgi:hypothetical protein